MIHAHKRARSIPRFAQQKIIRAIVHEHVDFPCLFLLQAQIRLLGYRNSSRSRNANALMAAGMRAIAKRLTA